LLRHWKQSAGQKPACKRQPPAQAEWTLVICEGQGDIAFKSMASINAYPFARQPKPTLAGVPQILRPHSLLGSNTPTTHGRFIIWLSQPCKTYHPPPHQNDRASRFASTCTTILPAIDAPPNAITSHQWTHQWMHYSHYRHCPHNRPSPPLFYLCHCPYRPHIALKKSYML